MIAFCIGFMLGGMFGMTLTAIVSVSDFDEFEEDRNVSRKED